eukprot:s4190_g2.t2
MTFFAQRTAPRNKCQAPQTPEELGAIGATPSSEFLEPEQLEAADTLAVTGRCQEIADPIGLLQQHVAKHLSRSVTTGDINYTFEKLECGNFVATVGFGDVQLQPCTGLPQGKKALAKKSAAEEALAQFEAANWTWKNPAKASCKSDRKESMGFLRQVRSTTAQEAKAKKHNKQGPSHSQGQFGNVLPDGKKQVLEQEPEDNAPDSTLPRNQAMVQCSAEADNPIGRINEIMASILRRPLSKEDVQYTFSEHDSTFTCAVTIASDGLLLEASGEPATTKRQAKSNAANALLLSKELETFLAELSREAPDPAMQGRRTIDSATGVQPQPWSEEVLHRLLRELLQSLGYLGREIPIRTTSSTPSRSWMKAQAGTLQEKSQAACRGRTCQLHLKLLTCSVH